VGGAVRGWSGTTSAGSLSLSPRGRIGWVQTPKTARRMNGKQKTAESILYEVNNIKPLEKYIYAPSVAQSILIQVLVDSTACTGREPRELTITTPYRRIIEDRLLTVLLYKYMSPVQYSFPSTCISNLPSWN
jgi:hypothetical protein